jgi:hypothetical protein
MCGLVKRLLQSRWQDNERVYGTDLAEELMKDAMYQLKAFIAALPSQ